MISRIAQQLHPLSITLVLVLALAATLRTATLGESLWLDELHTSWVVSGSWDELPTRAALGNNGPLYFTAVKWLTQVAGHRESTLRLLSWVAGMVVVAATFFIGRAVGLSVLAALLATALAAVDTNFVYYAREARPYALVQLLALTHGFFAWRLLSHPSVSDRSSHRSAAGRAVDSVGWIGTGIAMFHVHFTSALLFPAELMVCGVFWLSEAAVQRKRPDWSRVPFVLLLFTILAIGCLPAIELLQTIAERRDNWALFVRQQPWSESWAIYPLGAYLGLPMGFALVGRVAMGRSGSERSRRAGLPIRALVGSVLLVLLPVQMAWCLTEIDIARLFFRRYVIASSVFLPLSAGLLFDWGLCQWRLATRGWFFAASVTVFFTASIALMIGPVRLTPAGFVVTHSLHQHSHEDWRAAVRWLNSRPERYPVLLRSGLIEADNWFESPVPKRRDYCAFPVQALYRLRLELPVIVLPTTRREWLDQLDWNKLAEQGGIRLLARGRPKIIQQLENDFIKQLEQLGNQRIVRVERHRFGRLALITLTIEKQE